MERIYTFLFTDIEGSTRLWDQYPEAMGEIIARHDALLRQAIEAEHGRVFKTVGDAVYAVFNEAPDALRAALAAQHALHQEQWATIESLRVRMALHTGPASSRSGDFFGSTLNHIARLLAAGHGGQILLSQAAQKLVRDAMPADCALRDMGQRQLKDLPKPEHIYQVEDENLPQEFPPLKTLDIRPSNLPAQTTTLIGRDSEIAAVRRELRRNELRLLTLTGPGGTGKTRLALRAAAFMLDDFEDGVFYAPLATIDNPSLVATAIARSLGVAEQPGQTAQQAVGGYLADRKLLLVLDNFEQVLPAGPILTEWLSAAPGLKALVTSREPLGVYGEHEFPVPPLGLPSLSRLPSPDQLLAYPAIALFVERAQAVRSDFTLDKENSAIVVQICARLDGLPLAIELAAARVKFLTPAAILERLSDRLQLLSGGPRDLPTRQQSLRGAIAWSYDLLDQPEKRLFSRLSVFSGGGHMDDIETICTDEIVNDAFFILESLVNKSLVKALEIRGMMEPRFDMLESISAYAWAQLAISGEADEFQRRHTICYLGLAEQAEAAYYGSDQIAALNRLELEHDNLRAALRWAADACEQQLSLRLCSALWPFWLRRGYWSEGARRLTDALALNNSDLPESAAVAGALRGLGVMANEQGDTEAATSRLDAALAIYRNLDDTRGVALSLNDLGYTALLNGDTGGANALGQESRSLFASLGDVWGEAMALNTLGAVALAEGNSEEAARLCHESLDRFSAVGDRWGMALALNNLSLASLPLGDYADAMQYAEQSLTLFREVSTPGH
ncbi:MAG: tetratricopeptide repeat protein [Caldilineales bacterium]|nr:tetratricopeptide repeat protein [Caldilineales bacterium]